MKKCLVCCILFWVTISLNAQIALDVQMYKSYPIIIPNLKNLITIVNMDVNSFKATMAYYKYHPDDELSGTSYIYTNMNIDFFLNDDNGRGINTIMFDPVAGNNKFAGFWIISKQAYPRTCIQDFYQELSPYYSKSENGDRIYTLRYNNENYVIFAKPSSDQTSTAFQIYKKHNGATIPFSMEDKNNSFSSSTGTSSYGKTKEYDMTGKINYKNNEYRFKMHLNVNGKTVKGRYLVTNGERVWVTLSGTINSDGMVILRESKGNRQTGYYFEGHLNGGYFTGKYKATTRPLVMSFSASPIVSHQ